MFDDYNRDELAAAIDCVVASHVVRSPPLTRRERKGESHEAARDVTLSMSYEEEDACMSYARDVTLSTCACCR
jgi:hypothetical protein